MEILSKSKLLAAIKAQNAHLHVSSEFITAMQKKINEFAETLAHYSTITLSQTAPPSTGNIIKLKKLQHVYRKQSSFSIEQFRAAIESQLLAWLQACEVVMTHAKRSTLQQQDLLVVLLISIETNVIQPVHK